MQREGGNGQARDQLAVALDFPSARLALDCVDRLEGVCLWMKVGLELYCSAGNALIEELLRRDLKVFLDLKLHDIPNTVAGAVRSLAGVGASMLTVHALGGEAMLLAAAEAASSADSPKLVAVTVLTSMDAGQMRGIGLADDAGAQVVRLGTLATGCGIGGLVCSAEESLLLRERLGGRPYLVVPGIRPAGTDVGDQRRVATPGEAMARGASMLVVGRPVARAANPAQAAEAILMEMESALPVAG